jgi:hypothetical protein
MLPDELRKCHLYAASGCSVRQSNARGNREAASIAAGRLPKSPPLSTARSALPTPPGISADRLVVTVLPDNLMMSGSDLMLDASIYESILKAE